MSDRQPPPLYGNTKPGLPKTFQERLRELWEPHQYVRIMNIDSEVFYWQSLNPIDETYEIDRGPTKITYRRSPRQYSIKSGESMPLEGWNAYVAVEQLYKKVLARKMTENRGDRKEIIFNWQDPAGWDVFLPRIFMGAETPTFEGQTTPDPIKSVESEVAASLTPEQSEVAATETKYTVKDLAKELGIEVKA